MAIADRLAYIRELEGKIEELEDLVVYLWDSGVEGDGDNWDEHAQKVLRIKEKVERRRRE